MKKSSLSKNCYHLPKMKPTDTTGMILEWRLRTLRHNIISIADARVELEDGHPDAGRRKQLQDQITRLKSQEPELVSAINQLEQFPSSPQA